jgi:glycosyltransferase involved in cell wall biosynthesis
MRVRVHRADDGGCGWYRLLHALRILKNDGCDVVDDYERQYRGVMEPSLLGDRLTDIDEELDADVVVFQRPLTRQKVELMAAIRAKGAALVVEIDDDFSSLPLRHPGRVENDPTTNREQNWKWLELACERADLVTCSTPALAERYGKHGRVAILPNYVPAAYLDIARQHDRESLVIGWSGSTHTHVGDLQVTKGAMAEVLERTGALFGVVGTGDDVPQALKVDSVRACGWSPIEEYPRKLAQLDVGIVPLKRSAFNEAKSWLKGLEMAAVGVPFVATPTGPYRQLAELIPCELAETREEWVDRTVELLIDDDRRQWRAEAARSAVKLSLTVEGHAQEWWAAWTRAADLRAANVSAR